MEYPGKTVLYKRLETVPRELELLATEIAVKSGRWSGGANLSPQILNRLKRAALITSAGASTRIEGSSLSDDEIRSMIGGLKWQNMKDRDTQEVKGYYELLSLIYDNYQDIRITENNILEFHARLLKYSDKDERHKGSYKHVENSVSMTDEKGREIAVLFETAPAWQTPDQTRELIDWYNETINDPKYHKIIAIAAFVVHFLKIHPFQDGNGRLSRVLTDLLMLKAGYDYVPYVSLEKIVENNKAEYYIALRGSQVTFDTDHESIELWTKFFLGIALAQANEALGLLHISRLEQNLSENQGVVWQYFKDHPDDSVSVRALTAETGVNRETVKQSVGKLLNLKVIERFGAGRATHYKVNKDIYRE